MKINGETYLFNEKGNPVYGIQKIHFGDSGEYTTYAFGTNRGNCVMTKGERVKLEEATAPSPNSTSPTAARDSLA